ncbi:MAG TPA: ABC transporter substrate-binding protein [Puia sp.]|jgi:ABC-type branched-subunit amino acid transport system substrate-binding protein|nr:ABC transporter substrate-binding protein [Puia sp.]
MDSVKKIKIGWMIPYSGIFRDLKMNLQKGLDTVLKKEGAGVTITSYPEYIQAGGLKETEAALKKLLLYEQVDLVIGVTSGKTATGIIPLLENYRAPALILNLGADLPNRMLSSDYLFYNSLHLWKSEWAVGKWMQEKYGGEPSINMSIYEGGYGLHDSFRVGTSVSGATTVKINVIRNFSGPPDTKPLLQFIRDQQPEHAHILLSGKEGDQFLQLFHDQDWPSAPGLSVNPFMVEDNLGTTVPTGLDLYNASTWSRTLDTPENLAFVRDYTAAWEEPPNVFALLAYETGLVLVAALQESSPKISRQQLTASLGQVHPAGPRGILSVSTRPFQSNLPVYIRKPTLSSTTGGLENSIVHTTTGIEWDDPTLLVEQAQITGWQNPYLCV